MSTPYTPHDLYVQMTTGALGTALATDVTADNTTAIQAVLESTTGPFAGTVAHSPLSSNDFEALWVGSELDNVSASDKATLQLYVTPGTVNIGDAGVQSMIENIFGPASSPACPQTYAALTAMYTRPASFVEARYGSAFANGITTDQIEAALEGK